MKRGTVANCRGRSNPQPPPLASGGQDQKLRKELKAHVRKEIGVLAVPDDAQFTNSVPKTRSGKIRRRLVRDFAERKEKVGDTSRLEVASVLAQLRTEEE